MMDSLPLEAPWIWMIVAVVLGIIEIVMPGFFLIWIGVGALLTGVLTLAFDLPAPAQFATFAVLAIGAVYAGRRWFILNPIESDDPLLNDRAARLIGCTVTVVEAVDSGGGRVRVGDGVWSAKGADADVGARMRVTGIDDGVLLVEPLS